MPTISVSRDLFYEQLGVTMSDEKFDELCFEFGIELDEVTSEKLEVAKEVGAEKAKDLSEEIIYKIEVPANRYDLLSLEGLVESLRAFLSLSSAPKYKTIPGKCVMMVKAEVEQVRPLVVCAVLRGITFTPESYQSFIDLQDKLHNGIGRNRTIVSMGTHDLDTIEHPFTYEALPPEEIKFKPLNQNVVVDGRELMEFYENDLKIKKFLYIIRESPIYPVIYDAKRTVLSLPPIINSDHSKISLETRNVFIEVTGTDSNRINVALNTIVTAFSRYCSTPFTVETVKVIYPDGAELVTPNLSEREVSVSTEYINRLIGLNLTGEEMIKLLGKMMLTASVTDKDTLCIKIPPTRSDVLHACDVMEDVAIAYGFNNIPVHMPSSSTVGKALPINKLSDLVRREVALAGFSEVCTFTLCSHEENFGKLRKQDNGLEAVVLENPKTIEFEVVNTSLAPQILKTLASNKKMPLPIKVFQVLDVAIQDCNTDVGARNERRLCAAYCNLHSGFEVIHGLFDRIMLMLGVKPCNPGSTEGYYIRESDIGLYFPNRQAEVFYKGQSIGSFGIVHPEVLKNFDAPYVASILEINIEPFL